LRAAGDLHHRERSRVRGSAWARRLRPRSRADRVPRHAHRRGVARDRRGRTDPGLLRVELPGQLRVVVRLLASVRDRVRRLRHAGARAQGQLPLVSTAHRESPAPAGVMARIGLQLYTVRRELERDPEGTLRTIAELGYDGV